MSKLFGSLVFTSLMSVQALAGVTCSEPEFAPLQVSGNVYEFSVSRNCLLEDHSDGDLARLLDFQIEFRKEYIGTLKEEVVHDNGSTLYVHEYVEIDGGSMDLDLVEDYRLIDHDHLMIQVQSEHVEGVGNGKMTQEVSAFSEVIRTGEERYFISISNTVKIKKPAVFPKRTFINKVKSNLKRDIVNISEQNNANIEDHL